MKVSFSLSSSKPSNSTSSSPSNQHNESPNNKEFITHFDPSKPQTKKPIIIPPIPNEWNPQNQPITFDPTTQTEPDSNSSAIDRLMLLNLKNDLKRLSEGPGVEEFDDINVEDFARAYMKGYGWYEGRGIGKNATEDVKVVQFTNRVAGEGLGFVRTEDNGGDRKVDLKEKVCSMRTTSADICRRRGGPNVCSLQREDCLFVNVCSVTYHNPP